MAPRSSVLGRAASFVVSFAAVGRRPPSIRVNVGSMSKPRRVASGRFEATYTLPSEQYPQLAVFVATDRADRPIDWLAVPLLGQAQINTKSEANATVTITIGKTVYGPIIADKRGRATIGILAPPGLSHAPAVARDRLGNTRTERVRLGAPPFSQITTICPANSDRVYAVAAAANGSALPARSVAFSSKRGQFAANTRAKVGVQALITLADSTQLGDLVEITTSVGKRRRTGSSCQVKVRGGPVRSLVVSTAERYVAGSGKPLVVRVRLRGAGGKPAQPTLPTLSVNVGTLRSLRLESSATYRAEWSVPDRFDGRATATLRARVRGIEAPTTTVKLTHGKVTRVRGQAARYTLPADGLSRTTITATPVDAFGNPAPASSLTYSAKGQLQKRPGSATTLTLGYRSFATRNRFVDNVVIRDRNTGAIARVEIALTPDLGSIALSARAGFVTDFGDISGPSVAMDAQLRTSYLGGRLFGRLQIGYARSRKSGNIVMPSGDSVTETVTLLPITVGAYVDVLNVPVPLYAGIAGGAIYNAAGTESPSTGNVVNTSWSFVFSGAIGGHVPLGPGAVNVELSLLLANVSVAPIDDLAAIAQLALGYRMRF